jgi:dTMP kinase
MISSPEKLKGKFIVIDGPDGAGKSTQIELLTNHLVSLGLRVVSVVDPGTTEIGNRIRALLLDRHITEMSKMCETFLFMAARAQLISEKIKPALQEDSVVVCDRFVSATIAYQGALGIDRKVIIELGERAIEGLWPDLTIILDLPINIGMKRLGVIRKRLKSNSEQTNSQLTLFGDRMEVRESVYHREVRRVFRTIKRDYPSIVEYVRSTGTQEEVFNEILQVVSRIFTEE